MNICKDRYCDKYFVCFSDNSDISMGSDPENTDVSIVHASPFTLAVTAVK